MSQDTLYIGESDFESKSEREMGRGVARVDPRSMSHSIA